LKTAPPASPATLSGQHLREVVLDHQNGLFAGTNDLVRTIGGREPTTLEAFVRQHRDSFV
jgi:hypothetical protein